MRAAIDLLALLLVPAAAGAFGAGLVALGDERDLAALYWLAVGGLLLRAATDLLRPGQEGT